MTLKPVTDPRLLARLNGTPLAQSPADMEMSVPAASEDYASQQADMERIRASVPTMKRMDHGPLPESILGDIIDRTSSKFLEGATMHNADFSSVTEPATKWYQHLAEGAGGMAGMGVGVGALMGTGLGVIPAFGAYGGLKPADGIVDRGKNIATDAAFGATMHLAPKAAVNFVYKNLGTVAAENFGAFISKRPTRAVSDFVLFAGMNLKEGVPVKEALINAAGAAFGAQAVPGNIFGREEGRIAGKAKGAAQPKRDWTFDPVLAKYTQPMDVELFKSDMRLKDTTPYTKEQTAGANIPDLATAMKEYRLNEIYGEKPRESGIETHRKSLESIKAEKAKAKAARALLPTPGPIIEPMGRHQAPPVVGGPIPGGGASKEYPYKFRTGDTTLGTGFGALGEFSFMPKGNKYSDIISARHRPVEGVPETIPMSAYMRGEMTAKEAVDWLAENKDAIGGVVTENKLNAATKEYLTDEKKKEIQSRIDRGEAVEAGELSSYNKKVSAEIDAGKKGYKKYHEESAVKKIAKEMAVPVDVQQQIAKDQVGDLNPHWTNVVDKRRAIQGISGGVQDRPIEMHTQRLGEMAEQFNLKLANEMKGDALSALREAGIKPGSIESSAIGKVLDVFENGVSVSDFLGSPKAIEALAGVKPERQADVMRTADGLRRQFKSHWELRNSISETYGGKGVGKLPAYFPKVEKSYSWRNPIKKTEKATRPKKYSRSRDGSKVEEISDSHEMFRSGSKIDRDFDAYNVIDSYIGKTADRIGNQIVVKSGEAVATSLESAGHTASADAMRRVMQASYAGRSHGLNKAIIDAMSSNRPGMGVLGTARWTKQQFNHAKYTFNIPFMVARQWTSSGLMSAMPDISPDMVRDTMREMWGKEASELYHSTYTGAMKSQRRAGMGSEGSSGSITDAVTMQRGKVDRGIEWAQRPTSKVEEMAGRFSAVLAAKIAQKQGMSPEMSLRFVSDAIAKSQSEYHNASRAEILKNPLLNVLVPAQSFSVEQLNNVLEIYSPNIGLNHYKTTAQKNAAAARVFAVMALLGTAYKYINSHADWGDPEEAVKGGLTHLGETAASFIPGSSMVVPSGPSDGQLYPYVLIEDSAKAIGHAWNGDMDRAFGQIGKDVAPGGAQINRAIATDHYIEKGILREDERVQGSTMGWWTTESGKEYLRKMDGLGSSDSKKRPRKKRELIGGPRPRKRD